MSAYYGGEFRVNSDYTVDAGAASDLFVTDPETILVPEPGGDDYGYLNALTLVNPALRQDIDDYTTKVLAVGDSARGSDEITSSYRDPQGNTVRRDRLVSVDVATNDAADLVAEATLAEHDSPRTALTVGALGYIPGQYFEPGDTIYVYDPKTPELVDDSNDVPYRGQIIHPTTIRVAGVTWPIRDGYGVYYRGHDGTNPIWVDLTEYVEFEADGPATIEVGAVPRSSSVGGTIPTIDPIKGRIGVRAYRDTSQSIPGGTYTAVSFSHVDRDDAGFWDNGTPTRLTIPKAGWYMVGGCANFATAAGGYRRVLVRLNGSTYEIHDSRAPVATSATIVPVAGLLYLDAGDYLELYVFQTTGAALNIQATDSAPVLWVIAA